MRFRIFYFIWKTDQAVASDGDAAQYEAMDKNEIILSCPACGKRQPLAVAGAVLCVRCQCDLTLLRDIARRARAAVLTGEEYLRAGLSAPALEQAGVAWGLRHSAEAGKLGFLAAASCHDLRGMRRWLALMAKSGQV